MTTLNRSFFAAAATVLVTVGTLHTLQARRQREASVLRESNAGLVAEIYHRAEKPAAPVPRVADPTQQNLKTAPIADAAKPAVAAAEDYRNEGRATPLATLQTFAWACDRGDAAMVAKMVTFEGASRDKAAAYLSSLPAAARAQWPNVEAMAGTLLVGAYLNQPFPTARILETAVEEKMSDGRVALNLSGTTKQVTTYQKTDDGWAYVIPEKMVDNYLARLTAKQPGAK